MTTTVRRSRWAILLLALTILGLAALPAPAGAAEERAGTRATGQPPGLDHFLCYRTTRAAATWNPFPTQVQLNDQFGPSVVNLKAPNRLCNPVEKTRLDDGERTPVTNLAAHLLCYPIDSQDPVHTNKNVYVTTQFGDAELVAAQPTRTCLPSWKEYEPEFPFPSPQPPGLDHFKCYRVFYPAGSTDQFEAIPPGVRLVDQFGASQNGVGAPVELCNPTEKFRLDNGEQTPITNPEAHLMCFQVVSPRSYKLRVWVRNQFGQGLVTGVGTPTKFMTQDMLCLPAYKTEIAAG